MENLQKKMYCLFRAIMGLLIKYSYWDDLSLAEAY